MKVKYKFPVASQSKPKSTQDTIKKESGAKKDTLVVNQRIATAAKNKRFGECLALFDQMQKTGHIPTKHTYTNLVNGAVRCGKIAQAESFYAELNKKLGFCVEAATALMKGFFDANLLEKAKLLWAEVYARVPGPIGCRTVDTFIRGCLYNGLLSDAMSAFESTKTEKSAATFEMFHKLLCMAGKLPGPSSNYSTESTIASHMAFAKGLLLRGSLEEAKKTLNNIEKMIAADLIKTQDKFTKHKLNEQLREIKLLANIKTVTEPKSRVLVSPSFSLQAQELGFSGGVATAALLEDIIQSRSGESVIEICSGVGEWIVEKAKRETHRLFFASEIRVDRCFEIMVRMFAEGIDNLYILCGDINEFLDVLPQNTFQSIHINFPEPPAWHEKDTDSEGELLSRALLQRVLELRTATGRMFILSDNRSYMEVVSQRLDGARISRLKSDGTSYFDRMFGKKQDRFEIVV